MIWVLLWLLAGAAQGAEPVALESVTGRPVTAVQLDNPSRVRDRDVERLLTVEPGQRYDPAAMQRSLQLLSQKPEIRDVRVFATSGADGVALRVEVVPEPLVRSIRFTGNRVVEDRRLRAKLHSRVDRPLRPAVLAQDEEEIRAVYAEEGFPDAAVVPHWSPSTDGHWLRLEYRVVEGEPERIETLQLPAELPMERARLLFILGLAEGAPASRRQLREGTELLLEVLWREGFPEARAPRPRFQPAAGGGSRLDYPLEAGRRLDLRVTGLDAWAAAPLREILRSRYGEPMDRAWAARSAELLVEVLRADGYRDARVEPWFGRRFGRDRIEFRVARGVRYFVDEVEFSGNEYRSASRLRKYMSLVEGGVLRAPPFTREALQRDVRELEQYYASKGYLDARVAVLEEDFPASGAGALQIHVDEGQQYRFGDLTYACDAALTMAEAAEIAALEAGDEADVTALAAARKRLLQALESRGHVAPEVEYETDRDPARAVLDVHFRVTGGAQVQIGKVVVAGNARTQTKVLRRELTFDEGDPWNPDAALASQRRLYRLGFFQRVRIERLPEPAAEGVQDVRVLVEEQDAGNFSFGFGYGSEEGLKGFASLSHANLQGYGRSLGVRADVDRFDRSYALNFREPWLFNNPVDLRLTLVRSFEDREAYNLASTGFQASLEKEITEELRASLQYTLESNRLDESAEVETTSDVPDTYLLSAVGPVFAWDSRDDPFNPRRGFYHSFQAEWALEALGSEVRYDRYVGTASGFFSLDEYTLALLLRGGIALKLGQAVDDLPVNKRFFLGGRTTVRGFEKDEVGPQSDGVPLGGDAMFNSKVEVRFPLWLEFAGALFWDTGNVWNRSRDAFSLGDLRQAAGGGLRYVTPVGPLALDLGFKLDRQSGEDPYAWHFTIGNVF